jgi:hypothetical protein
MEKKDAKKDETVENKAAPAAQTTPAVLDENRVKAMIEEAINPITGALKAMTESMKAMAENIKPQEKKEEKIETKAAPEIPEWAKGITDSLKSIDEKLTKAPSRKGVVLEEEEEEEEEEVESEVPAKALKGFNDEASRTFAKHAMDNPDVHAALSVSEKKAVGDCYLQMMQKATSKK